MLVLSCRVAVGVSFRLRKGGLISFDLEPSVLPSNYEKQPEIEVRQR